MMPSPIDLIVLDLVMPDMNGSEVLDLLRRIDPRARMLLSSGYSIDGQAQDVLNRGCAGFFQKPLSIVELSDRLRAILDR